MVRYNVDAGVAHMTTNWIRMRVWADRLRSRGEGGCLRGEYEKRIRVCLYSVALGHRLCGIRLLRMRNEVSILDLTEKGVEQIVYGGTMPMSLCVCLRALFSFLPKTGMLMLLLGIKSFCQRVFINA